MAMRAHYFTKFEIGECYHVYNASVDGEPIFETDFYCKFMLENLRAYLLPLVDLYAWCLMRNHFHLLFKVAPKGLAHVAISDRDIDWHSKVSHALGVVCQVFALHYNRAHRRKGSVFQNPFKRAHVDSSDYFTQMIYYIHSNPSHHQVRSNFENYPWSSYKTLIAHTATVLDRGVVLGWFGGRDEFISYHAERPRLQKQEFFIDSSHLGF